MEFPIRSGMYKGYDFYFFNYGFRSLNDFRLVVNVVVKKDLQPVCFYELFIEDEQQAFANAKEFQERFISNPSEYLNINYDANQ